MDFRLGKNHWAMAEGYLPSDKTEQQEHFTAYVTICVLNTTNEEARLRLYIYFADREPIGPYKFYLEPRRTIHIRFNDLDDPEPVPKGINFASVLRSDVPVIVQQTRLEAHGQENDMLSAIAYWE